MSSRHKQKTSAAADLVTTNIVRREGRLTLFWPIAFALWGFLCLSVYLWQILKIYA